MTKPTTFINVVPASASNGKLSTSKTVSNQIIFINVGLTNTRGDKLETMHRELCRWIIEAKFRHCGIISEPYQSIWTDDSGVTYADECVAFKITVPKIHAWTLAAIEEKINSIRVLCKQEAVAFHTISPQGRHYREVYYGPDRPQDALIFDPNHFHYVV